MCVYIHIYIYIYSTTYMSDNHLKQRQLPEMAMDKSFNFSGFLKCRLLK